MALNNLLLLKYACLKSTEFHHMLFWYTLKRIEACVVFAFLWVRGREIERERERERAFSKFSKHIMLMCQVSTVSAWNKSLWYHPHYYRYFLSRLQKYFKEKNFEIVSFNSFRNRVNSKFKFLSNFNNKSTSYVWLFSA